MFGKMMKRRGLPSIEDWFGPMDERELVECLAVGDDEPLLRAVVHVLHRESLKLSGSAGGTDLPAEQAKGLAMSACAVEDACDELLRLVEVARRRVRGAEMGDHKGAPVRDEGR